MAVHGIEIEVGQKWRCRDGQVREVVGYANKPTYRWRLDNDKYITAIGRSHAPGRNHYCDLIELIADAPKQQIDVAMADPDYVDANALAAETLQSLGWSFKENCWVQDNVVDMKAPSLALSHPLYPVYMAAIEQAMYGKGERHGGNTIPFLDQPWVHYVKMHGRGFATGQSAKKLEEAASTREGKAFETEVLGAIVYAGMAILKERGVV